MIEEAIDEEVLYAIMNMIALEEHMIESFNKTDIIQYSEIADMQRKIRQKTLQLIKKVEKNTGGNFRDYKAEVWCALKHALVTKMHLLETLEKLQKMKDEDRILICNDIMKMQNKIIQFLFTVYKGDVNVEVDKEDTKKKKGRK